MIYRAIRYPCLELSDDFVSIYYALIVVVQVFWRVKKKLMNIALHVWATFACLFTAKHF